MVGMLFSCMVTLCSELCVRKLQQAIDDTRGQQRACVRAFTLELGVLNRQGTNLDVWIKIYLCNQFSKLACLIALSAASRTKRSCFGA